MLTKSPTDDLINKINLVNTKNGIILWKVKNNHIVIVSNKTEIVISQEWNGGRPILKRMTNFIKIGIHKILKVPIKKNNLCSSKYFTTTLFLNK